MTKKKRRSSAQREKQWTATDVASMLSNPMYGYGTVFEPLEVVIHRIQELQLHLAAERLARPQPFTLEELDERFHALFRDLEQSGVCTRSPDVQPIVPKVQWLRTQQVTIEKLANAQDL